MQTELALISKPFERELDSDVGVLVDVLSDIEMQFDCRFALTGGFIRDYGIRPYNDVDIVATNVHTFERELRRLGMYRVPEGRGDNIPQAYFLNPYSLKELPIHFIEADNQFADAPKHFDFTVNQFALKSDMQVYATPQTWLDFNKKILRMNKDANLTTNAVMRAVRFSAKLDFVFDTKTETTLREYVAKLVDGARPAEGQLATASNRVVSGIKKMVEDGVAEKSLLLLKELKFPHVENMRDLMELHDRHQKLIAKGNAFIQDVRHYH